MKTKLILLLIVIAALAVRLYRLPADPPSLYWDEAAIGYDAYSLYRTGHDMHGNSWLQPIFPSYGDYKMPVYIWLTSLVMRVVGVNELAVRLPSLLFGVLGVLLSYTLSCSLFTQKRFGLFAASIFALMPWDIHFSRVGFEGHVGMVLLLLTVWLWLGGLKRWYFFPLSALSAAAATYTYFSVRVVIPLLLFGFVLLWWKEARSKWAVIALGICIFLAFMIPLTRSPYYESSNQLRLSTQNLLSSDSYILLSNQLRHGAHNSWWSWVLYHRYVLLLWQFIQQIGAFFDVRYLFFSGDSNLRHGSGASGLMLFSFLPFFALGWKRLFETQTRSAIFLLWWWLSSLVPAAIPTVVPHALRSINALPVLVIACGVGVAQLWLKRYRALFVGLCGFVLLTFAGFYHDYLSHYPIRAAADWQYGYKQMALLARTLGGDYPSVYVTSGDRVYLYFLFYNRIDPKSLYGQFHQFQLSSFDQFAFGPVTDEAVSTLPTGSLVIGSTDELNGLSVDQGLRTVISDPAGNNIYGAFVVKEQHAQKTI